MVRTAHTRPAAGREEATVAGEHKELRARLESDKKRFLEELEQLRVAGQPGDERREGSPFGKREEEATESLELERRLALEKQLKGFRIDFNTRLAKFDKDTYGLCESCGKPIEVARLEALPRAKLCLDCKALQTKNGKGRLAPR